MYAEVFPHEKNIFLFKENVTIWNTIGIFVSQQSLGKVRAEGLTEDRESSQKYK